MAEHPDRPVALEPEPELDPVDAARSVVAVGHRPPEDAAGIGHVDLEVVVGDCAVELEPDHRRTQAHAALDAVRHEGEGGVGDLTPAAVGREPTRDTAHGCDGAGGAPSSSKNSSSA